MAEAAARQGYDTLALCDRDGVYGAPRFFGAARKHGIKPIVGAEVTLAGAPPVLLLVESREGYRNLCRLLTRAKAGHKKEPSGRPAAGVSHDLLAEHAAGLIALGGATARDDLPRLLSAFGRDRLHLEAQRHFDAAEAHAGRAAMEQARAHGIGVVATNDVRYASPAQRAVHDVLTCARHRRTVDEIGRLLSCNGERWLKPAEQIQALFADLPAAVRATRAIAERCAFTLADLGYVFPTFDVPPRHTHQSFLQALPCPGIRAPHPDQRHDDPLLRQPPPPPH